MKSSRNTILHADEMFDFCTQMSMILAGGLSVEDGLEIIQKDSVNTRIQDACSDLLIKLSEEGSITAAMKDSDYFDSYAKKMVEIGEISGHLDGVMQELAVYYERNADLKQSLKDALTYPSILLVMMWVVVGIIVWKVLPIFEKVFHTMGTSFQSGSFSMMEFGTIFAWISFIILTLLCIIVIIIILNYRKQGSRNLLSKVFLTKKLYHNMVMAKMTYALSLFITSGYEMEEALEYVNEVVDDQEVNEKINICREGMKHDESFIHCLQKTNLYDGVYASMIAAGFHSGKSDEVMQKVSSLYEKEVDHSISSFLNTIEPIIVIFLSVIVGIILLSVMLPLMSIMSTI